MKRYLLVLFMLLNVSMAFAQSAEGRYSSRLTQDGAIYFIMPHSIKDLSHIKKFEYDITLLNWTDSATVNFTFESDLMSLPENFSLKSGDKTYPCSSYSPLFIDIRKKHYEIRITSKFLVSDIETIFSAPWPPVFSFTQGQTDVRATYKQKAWDKDRKKLSDIIHLFKYSK